MASEAHHNEDHVEVTLRRVGLREGRPRVVVDETRAIGWERGPVRAAEIEQRLGLSGKPPS